jgi:hypothetical protein
MLDRLVHNAQRIELTSKHAKDQRQTNPNPLPKTHRP